MITADDVEDVTWKKDSSAKSDSQARAQRKLRELDVAGEFFEISFNGAAG